MNKNLKTLLVSGAIALSIVGNGLSVSDAMTYMYTNSNVILRQYNNTSSKKIATVNKGTRVTTYGLNNGWYSVKVNGKWGYIRKDLLTAKLTNNITVNKGVTLRKLIIVNSYYHYTYLYENGNLVKTYRNATGKPSTPTPTGKFSVVNKIVNPYYSAKNIKGGASNNPLGVRWLGIGGKYGLHGTCYPNSIGRNASNGCVRHKNNDIIDLYNRTPLNTKVIITNKPMINRQVAQLYGYKVN